MSTKATAARIYEYGEPDVFRFETMDVPDPVGHEGSVADRYKRLFRIYLAFHVRGHRDELPVALDSLRHPDSRHGSPSLTASSALSSTLVHRRGDYHLRAVVPAL